MEEPLMHPGINSSTMEGWNTIVPTDIPSCVDGGGESVEHVAVDYVCRFGAQIHGAEI